MESKICTKCKEVKPLDGFYRLKTTTPRYTSWCIDCRKVDKVRRNRVRYQTDPSFRSKQLLKKKELWKTDETFRRASKVRHLKNRYGISVDQYNDLLLNYNNSCAICGAHQSKVNHLLCVDHCHSTNQVRGLLCSSCNVGIGYFKDSAEILAQAIEYLKAAQSRRLLDSSKEQK